MARRIPLLFEISYQIMWIFPLFFENPTQISGLKEQIPLGKPILVFEQFAGFHGDRVEIDDKRRPVDVTFQDF